MAEVVLQHEPRPADQAVRYMLFSDAHIIHSGAKVPNEVCHIVDTTPSASPRTWYKLPGAGVEPLWL